MKMVGYACIRRFDDDLSGDVFIDHFTVSHTPEGAEKKGHKSVYCFCPLVRIAKVSVEEVKDAT
jgi:hypothetical protein